MADSFEKLNEEIISCDRCAGIKSPLLKTSIRNRGLASNIMIVGRNPGNKEAEAGRPFAGPSGKRLDDWLIQCGGNKENPRSGIYFTSALKCFCDSRKTDFKQMAANCESFLKRQINLVKPKLIITLGEDSYLHVAETQDSFNQALYKIYKTEELILISKFDYHYHLLVWPHPSPLNRLLNDDENKRKLIQTFDVVRKYL